MCLDLVILVICPLLHMLYVVWMGLALMERQRCLWMLQVDNIHIWRELNRLVVRRTRELSRSQCPLINLLWLAIMTKMLGVTFKFSSYSHLELLILVMVGHIGRLRDSCEVVQRWYTKIRSCIVVRLPLCVVQLYERGAFNGEGRLRIIIFICKL